MSRCGRSPPRKAGAAGSFGEKSWRCSIRRSETFAPAPWPRTPADCGRSSKSAPGLSASQASEQNESGLLRCSIVWKQVIRLSDWRANESSRRTSCRINSRTEGSASSIGATRRLDSRDVLKSAPAAHPKRAVARPDVGRAIAVGQPVLEPIEDPAVRFASKPRFLRAGEVGLAIQRSSASGAGDSRA